MARWIAPLAVALTMAGQTGKPALLRPAVGNIHVIVFVGTECPISNRYAPELGRIAREYASRGVRMFLAYADPAVDEARVTKHVAEFYPGVTISPYLDRDGSLARELGARATPTAVILTPMGRVYRGRIDDLYLSLTQVRREPTERTLRLSLDAVLGGRPVPHPETPAVGCSIGGSS